MHMEDLIARVTSPEADVSSQLHSKTISMMSARERSSHTSTYATIPGNMERLVRETAQTQPPHRSMLDSGKAEVLDALMFLEGSGRRHCAV